MDTPKLSKPTVSTKNTKFRKPFLILQTGSNSRIGTPMPSRKISPVIVPKSNLCVDNSDDSNCINLNVNVNKSHTDSVDQSLQTCNTSDDLKLRKEHGTIDSNVVESVSNIFDVNQSSRSKPDLVAELSAMKSKQSMQLLKSTCDNAVELENSSQLKSKSNIPYQEAAINSSEIQNSSGKKPSVFDAKSLEIFRSLEQEEEKMEETQPIDGQMENKVETPKVKEEKILEKHIEIAYIGMSVTMCNNTNGQLNDARIEGEKEMNDLVGHTLCLPLCTNISSDVQKPNSNFSMKTVKSVSMHKTQRKTEYKRLSLQESAFNSSKSASKKQPEKFSKRESTLSDDKPVNVSIKQKKLKFYSADVDSIGQVTTNVNTVSVNKPEGEEKLRYITNKEASSRKHKNIRRRLEDDFVAHQLDYKKIPDAKKSKVENRTAINHKPLVIKKKRKYHSSSEDDEMMTIEPEFKKKKLAQQIIQFISGADIKIGSKKVKNYKVSKLIIERKKKSKPKPTLQHTTAGDFMVTDNPCSLPSKFTSKEFKFRF